MATQLGCFYGPFKDHKFKYEYFIHELCGLWTPNIFLDSSGKLINVVKEIRRSYKLKCSYCNQKGAGLGCSQPKCRKDYHYLCAIASDCIKDNQNYIVFCKSHFLNDRENEDIEQYGDCTVCLSGFDEDKLLICENCSKTIHTYCSIPAITQIPEGDYICNDCLAKEKINNNNKYIYNDIHMQQ